MILCLRDVDFNKIKLSFEKEETEAMFFKRHYLTKWKDVTA